MAQFELNIYGNDDEVINRYETEKVRWGVFMQALALNDSLETKTPAEQFNAISEFVKKIFPTLTDADLERADYEDVLNTFKQLIRKANAISGGAPAAGKVNTAKNAAGAE